MLLLSLLLSFALHFTACLARPISPVASLPLPDQQHPPRTAPEVLRYSHKEASIDFSLPCPGCISAADESLVFQLHLLPSVDDTLLSFALNDYRFTLSLESFEPSLSHAVPALDTSGHVRSVLLSWSNSNSTFLPELIVPDTDAKVIHFAIVNVDAVSEPASGFTVVMETNVRRPHLLGIMADSKANFIRLSTSEDSFTMLALPEQNEENPMPPTGTFNIASEVEYLRYLETQAAGLRMQIAAKKAAINDKLRENRDQLCLKHLIKECDGIVCAARVVAQRICDTIGINVDPIFGFPSSENQQYISSSQKAAVASTIEITNTTYTTQGLSLPLLLTKNGSSNPLHAMHLTEPPHPVIYVLEVLAALFGLSSLWILIQKKCMSARTRAERLADREERKTRRTYRRAARRALMRQRWEDLLASLNCFRPKSTKPELNNDYEDKRALILQDAFLERDLDTAEKGEVMEAEIRELRHAHEIVAGLVRVDGHSRQHEHQYSGANRYALATPIHDPPPPMVALPYTPSDQASRSRASSQTLPSYTSEILPDYTSRYARSRRLSGASSDDIAVELGHHHHDGRRARSMPRSSRRSDNSGSSILVVSTRPSFETLRSTRQSADTQRTVEV